MTDDKIDKTNDTLDKKGTTRRELLGGSAKVAAFASAGGLAGFAFRHIGRYSRIRSTHPDPQERHGPCW